jgi:HD-like signal output (HDOD) protein
MYKISATKLLANTIAMAVGMQTLAKHADLDPKVGYTLGLLNNLGIIVLQRMAFMHEIPAGAGNFATIEETLKWEKSTFNCTHNDIGAAVLKFWGMNTLFSAVIETNSLGENNNETQKWRELLKIAKKIVANTEFNLGASSDITEITQEHLEELDIIINDPEELQKEIERNTTQLCEKLHLTESTT